MKFLALIVAAACIGALIPFQGGVNSKLGASLGQPFLATLISFTGGTLTVLLIVLITSGGLPKWTPSTPTPWYWFIGGLPGVVFVTTTLVLIPRIGFANTVGPMLVGQLICTLVLDHFGILVREQRHINPQRVIGAVLLISGLMLIVRDRDPARAAAHSLSEPPAPTVSAATPTPVPATDRA